MNTNGINFDIGLPLIKQDELDLLYIDWLPEQTEKLNLWMRDITANPIIVTGQIGCGKTTFIQKAIYATKTKPDLTINLDKITTISKGSF